MLGLGVYCTGREYRGANVLCGSSEYWDLKNVH